MLVTWQPNCTAVSVFIENICKRPGGTSECGKELLTVKYEWRAEYRSIEQNLISERHLTSSFHFEYGGWRCQNMYIYPSQAYSLFLKVHYFWGCTEGTSGPGLQTRLVLIKCIKAEGWKIGLHGQQSKINVQIRS